MNSEFAFWSQNSTRIERTPGVGVIRVLSFFLENRGSVISNQGSVKDRLITDYW